MLTDDTTQKPDVARPRLTVELIPTHQSNLNLHFALSQKDWRRLRGSVVGAAQGVCQICCASADKLECHESWKFDDRRKTQTLVALVAICRLCHLAKHTGQANWAGVDYDEAEAHLGRVNGWTPRATRAYVKKAEAQHKMRSRHYYEVDLSYVRQFGLRTIPSYESTFIDVADDSEISSLAKRASKASRREDWIAIYRTRHGSGDVCFDAGTVEPCTDDREEVDLLISSFFQMRHEHGTPVGLYPRGTPESKILDDLKAWIARRDARARGRAKPQC